MHYLYANSEEYDRFSNPQSRFVKMSIAGVHPISFKRLDEAVNYLKDNEGNFTLYEGDHPKVSAFWDYCNRQQEETEKQARMYRSQERHSGQRDTL